MASSYPGALDSFTTKQDEVDDVEAAHVNALQDSVVAIQTELGLDPAGAETDVLTRLDKSLPKDYLSKYGITVGADTLNDIVFPVILAKDNADSISMRLAASLTKQIDFDWASGSGNGGFPSGLTLTADTWYHIGLVDESDGSIDAGFDTSISFTNLLSDSGGTKFRRLGSILTNGSSQITAFNHFGPLWFWDNPPLDVDVTDQNVTQVSRVLSVPPDVNVLALINVVIQRTGSDTAGIYVRHTSITDELPSFTAAPLMHLGHETGTTAEKSGTMVQAITGTNKVVFTRAVGGASVLRMSTIAWLDNFIA